VGAEALALASRLSRRVGDDQTAAANLHQALASARGEKVAPLHLSLAKLYEHDLKDLPRALQHARLAASAEGADASRRRIERLERKLSRTTRESTLDFGTPPSRTEP
jgi:hypothetical protein